MIRIIVYNNNNKNYTNDNKNGSWAPSPALYGSRQILNLRCAW